MLCLITVRGNKTASIFFKSILFDGKVNLVRAFGKSKLKFPIAFKSVEKNKIKIKEKLEFLRKISF